VRECCLWHRIPEKEKRPLREVKTCKNVSIMVSFSQVYVWQYDFAEKKKAILNKLKLQKYIV
jgi:hypothetical protein